MIGAGALEEILDINCTLYFMADNADNSCTGDNTFHGMGMVAAVINGKFAFKPVPKSVVSNDDSKKYSSIPIYMYKDIKLINKNSYICLPDTNSLLTGNPTDVLWQMSWFFGNPMPSWSGAMQLFYDKRPKEHNGKASITFLPLIDMPSRDMSCIYSTLKCLSNLAYQKQKTPIITFDQPLFWKASKITNNTNDTSLKNIVLMLGNFHTIMNFLGAIGTLMENTGLSNILQVVYKEHTVPHMMTGKAISRGLRGHMIVDQCLSTLLANIFMEETENTMKEQLSILFSSLKSGEVNIDNVIRTDVLCEISKNLKQKKIT